MEEAGCEPRWLVLAVRSSLNYNSVSRVVGENIGSEEQIYFWCAHLVKDLSKVASFLYVLNDHLSYKLRYLLWRYVSYQYAFCFGCVKYGVP